MSYVQDFASKWLKWYGIPGAVLGLLMLGVIVLILHKLGSEDQELKLELSDRGYVFLAVMCIIGASSILYRQQAVWQNQLRGFIMLVYLLLCSVTDYYTQQVYDVIQMAACVLMAGMILLGHASPSRGAELIVFTLLQALLFRKMYGEADVMCFLICALSLVERGIFVWTCHMGLAFLFLGVVQGGKHNIASDGNLKVPVAFFPYITVAYGLLF